METINPSGVVNPEIIISVDTENLIEFYETGDGRYFASLSKSNQFPFRVIVDESDPEGFLYSCLCFQVPFRSDVVRDSEHKRIQL